MTYQQKFDELQKIFSEKFDAYHGLQKKFSLGNYDESDHFLKAKGEFEQSGNDVQTFLRLFKENNAAPGDEFGAEGERCS
jgi:hypothetical protein